MNNLRRILQELQYRRLRRKITDHQLQLILSHARTVRIPRPAYPRYDLRPALAALATLHTLTTTAIIRFLHPVQTAGLPLTLFTWAASLYTTLAIAHRLLTLTRPPYHWLR